MSFLFLKFSSLIYNNTLQHLVFYLNSICFKHACDNIFVYMQSNKNVLGAAGIGIPPDAVKKWDLDGGRLLMAALNT